MVIGWISLFAIWFISPVGASSAQDTGSVVFKSGSVLKVGPKRRFKTPSEAAMAVRRGDSVRIDPGSYSDCAVWRTPDITLMGAGPGYAHIRDISCEGKALWVFYEGPARVENIRFSGARVSRRKGEGIRWEGRGWLVVHRSKLDRNQMAILTHNRLVSSLAVSDSIFDKNGFCETYYGHGIYLRARNLRRVDFNVDRACLRDPQYPLWSSHKIPSACHTHHRESTVGWARRHGELCDQPAQ